VIIYSITFFFQNNYFFFFFFFDNYYLFINPYVPRRSKRATNDFTNLLSKHEKVTWAEQQQSRNRVKRDFIDKRAQEERVYRSVSFSDPKWAKEWYLVSIILSFLFNIIFKIFLYRKIQDQKLQVNYQNLIYMFYLHGQLVILVKVLK